MLIPLVGEIRLFLRRPTLAGDGGVRVASSPYLLEPAAKSKFYFTIPPPPAVFIGEYILILVGIGYMLFGPRVYSQTRERPRDRPRVLRFCLDSFAVPPSSASATCSAPGELKRAGL